MRSLMPLPKPLLKWVLIIVTIVLLTALSVTARPLCHYGPFPFPEPAIGEHCHTIWAVKHFMIGDTSQP
jgi:hypothetical protein